MKALLLVPLVVMSGNAAAEWVSVSAGDKATIYADPATVRRNGNMVKMWTLVDYKQAQRLTDAKPFLSTKAQDEYDCKEEQRRLVYITDFSEHMGNGEVGVSTHGDGEWTPVTPGSVTEVLWKLACGKKWRTMPRVVAVSARANCALT